jgi:Integrase zinc binding domain
MEQWGGEYQIEEDTDAHWWKADAPVVPENDQLRRDILQRYHDHPLAGHPGISNTLYAIHQNFWWPNLKTHVTQYVKGWATCQSTKPLTHRPKPPMAPLEPQEQEADNVPFQVISIDLITDLPLSDGSNSILTIMDHDCSKAAIFLPCTKEISTEGVIDLYAKHVFPHYGIPQRIISNRDPHFVSNLAQGICEKLGISQNISTAYHPQTDGQSE